MNKEIYIGTGFIVEDFETSFNKREMQEYKKDSKKAEIWTTVRTKSCGCKKQWICIYRDDLKKFTTHSRTEDKCEKHTLPNNT